MRPYEQKKLHRLKRLKSNAVNSRHARIILLSRGGVRNRDIAERVDCSPQWVRQIIHRFNDKGLQGISWYPWIHASARSRFSADVQEQIAEVVLSPPKTLIGMTRWSLSKLRGYLLEQKIIAASSTAWLAVLLHRAKIRWRQTKTWKDSTDPAFEAKRQAIRRLYQRRPANGRRICLDEFGPLNL